MAESVDYLKKIPLIALSLKSQNRLAVYLDPFTVLPASNGLLRDWRGICRLVGLPIQYESFLASKTNPTTELIKTLVTENHRITFADFLEMLGKMDRWDVVDDTYNLFVADAEKHLKQQERFNCSQHQMIAPSICNEINPNCLTIDNTITIFADQNSPLQRSVAVTFADKDVDLATEMIEKVDIGFKATATGNWRDFWTLARLTFDISAAPGDGPVKIYANSRNMVEVIITVEIVDKNDKDLNLTYDEIKNQLYFCNSHTGDNLNSWWLIYDNPNEYVNGSGACTGYTRHKLKHFRKYICCSKHERNEIREKISVGINVPGLGKFDTSVHGTATKMPLGRIFKSPKVVELVALRPIDYSVYHNLSLYNSGIETINSAVVWESRYSGAGPFKKHWDGACKRRIVYIRPNYQVTGQTKFKRIEVYYDGPISNTQVSTGTTKWWIDTPHQHSFTLVRNAIGRTLPCAVTGRAEGNDYHVNVWFSGQSHIVCDGNFFIEDNSYYYKYNENNATIVDEKLNDDTENGAAILVLYKFTLPENNCRQTKWKDVIKTVTVNVIDCYGNDGSFQVVFNTGDEAHLK